MYVCCFIFLKKTVHSNFTFTYHLRDYFNLQATSRQHLISLAAVKCWSGQNQTKLTYPVFSLLLSSTSEDGSSLAFFRFDSTLSSSSEMSSSSLFAVLLLSLSADDCCDSLIEAFRAASNSF